MSAGEALTDSERQQIDKAIRAAETVCRWEFSVYVGPVEGDPRQFAERLHGALTAPTHSVMIVLDVAARALEIVTGSTVRTSLTDGEVRVAMVEMQAQFALGEYTDGLVRGLQRLGAYAHKPTTLHSERVGE